MGKEMFLNLKLSVVGGRWAVWNAKDGRWVRFRKDVNPEAVTKELDLMIEKLKAVD